LEWRVELLIIAIKGGRRGVLGAGGKEKNMKKVND